VASSSGDHGPLFTLALSQQGALPITTNQPNQSKSNTKTNPSYEKQRVFESEVAANAIRFYKEMEEKTGKRQRKIETECTNNVTFRELRALAKTYTEKASFGFCLEVGVIK